MITVTQSARKFAATTKRGMYERARYEAVIIENGVEIGHTANHESHSDAYAAGMQIRKAFRLSQKAA